jgi:hypothetical protein
VLLGIIGLLGANEAIEPMLDSGASLAWRSLMFNALDRAFCEVKLWRDL